MKTSNVHTLLVPTYNRQQCLDASLRYLASSDLSVTILDSGTTPARVDDHFQAQPDRYRLRRYSPQMYILTKFYEGLKTVNTPYVSLCPDDDLIFPETIHKCIDVLEATPDAVAAQGVYVTFDLEDAPPHRITLGSGWDSSSTSADGAGPRMIQLFDLYHPNFYAVFRTDVMRAIFAAIDESAIRDYHYSEVFQAAATVISGKVIRLPDIYCARRNWPAADHTTEDINRMRCFDWLKKDYMSFANYYPILRETLVKWWQRCDTKMSVVEMQRWCDAVNMLLLARTFKDYPYDETLKINRAGLQLTNVMAAEIFALRDSLRQGFGTQNEERLTVVQRVRRKLGRWLNDVASSLDGSKRAQPVVDPLDAHLAQAQRAFLEHGVLLKDDFKLAALHPAVLPAATVVQRYVDECYLAASRQATPAGSVDLKAAADAA